MAVSVQGRTLRRGDIVSVDLDGSTGVEIKNGDGTDVRSCVVVQNDKGNAYSPTTIIVPLSDAVKNQRSLSILVPLSASELGSGGKDSVAHCEQIRTIDIAARVKRIVGHLGSEAMGRIDEALAISIGH